MPRYTIKEREMIRRIAVIYAVGVAGFIIPYYVNAVSKHNPQCAPEGCESLFIVCPVPSLQYKPDWSDRDEIVDSILGDFSKRIGIDIMTHIVTRTVYTPQEWEKQFNLYMGSGLGLSNRLSQLGALRQKHYEEE